MQVETPARGDCSRARAGSGRLALGLMVRGRVGGEVAEPVLFWHWNWNAPSWPASATTTVNMLLCTSITRSLVRSFHRFPLPFRGATLPLEHTVKWLSTVSCYRCPAKGAGAHGLDFSPARPTSTSSGSLCWMLQRFTPGFHHSSWAAGHPDRPGGPPHNNPLHFPTLGKVCGIRHPARYPASKGPPARPTAL